MESHCQWLTRFVEDVQLWWYVRSFASGHCRGTFQGVFGQISEVYCCVRCEKPVSRPRGHWLRTRRLDERLACLWFNNAGLLPISISCNKNLTLSPKSWIYHKSTVAPFVWSFCTARGYHLNHRTGFQCHMSGNCDIHGAFYFYRNIPKLIIL